MKRNILRIGTSAFIAVFLFALPAHANVGVPMIFITLPVMLVALIPIIGIEAYVLLERLGLSFWKSVEVASAANFGSTVIGTPVTWFLLLLVDLFAGGGSGYGIGTAKARFLTVTLGAPWLPPYEDKTMNWIVPAAGFVLLIPFFFASWLVEYEVGIWILDEMNAGNVSSAVLMGNLITYGILAALVAAVTLYEYFTTATENASPTVADATVRLATQRPLPKLKAFEVRIAGKGLIAIPGQAREIANAGEGREPHGDVRRVEPARPKRAAVGG